MALIVVLVGRLMRQIEGEEGRDPMLMLLSAILLLSLAFTGHTQANEAALRVIRAGIIPETRPISRDAWAGRVQSLSAGSGSNYRRERHRP
jgi:hypothetical protein